MTDEEVIREALRTVTDYAKRHPDNQFDINQCIEWVLASVKGVWKRARNYAPYMTLTQEDLDELTRLVCRITPDLRTRACLKAAECQKGRKIRQINISTAEALISYELRQRGLPYHLEWQQFRVKVSIRLDHARALTFIVWFKDIREGRLHQVLEEVLAVAEALNRTSNQITVHSSRTCKDWSN